MARWTMRAAALAVAALVAACGGGEKAPITSVKVMGDSLADSGTFGLKFTVQGTAPTGAGSTPIWPELVNARSALPELCPAYRQGAAGFTTAAGCTNYAIGGGRINYPQDASNPLSIRTQLARAATVHGSYTSQDLVLIDGGGNDAADLVGAYLGASSPAGAVAYRSLLISLLPAATVDGLLAQGAVGAGQAGGAYMQQLASVFSDAIKAQTLDKGAQKVVVLNAPDITLTPRFAAVLGGVAQAYGGGAAGQAAAAQVQGLIRQWIGAFNTQLTAKFNGVATVAVIDFYGVFADQVANPAKYGFTNVKDTACPVVGVGSDGLPSYSFPTCTAAALSAKPPTGGTADWWKTYAFSDGFHPTPQAHQLLADEVNKAVTAKGWNRD
ncbi:MAG: SGNH/GDSL hydrolase family protein [Betaproteobacteria bacterium]